MHWQLSPSLLPLLVSAAISAALGVFAWRHRYVASARGFALLMGASAWWSLFYAVYRSSTELEWKYAWALAVVAGAVVVPVAWTLFALQYTGRERWLTRRGVALIAGVPALTLALALTNEAHHLFWTRFELVRRGGLVGVDSVNGPGFWLHVGWSWALMSVSVLVLVLKVLRSPHLYRRQAAVLLFGALVPWVGNVLHLSGMVRFPANPMPFLFTLSGALFAWSIFRFRFLDVLPVARERVIEGMDDGVVVLDEKGRLLDLNPAARRIFGVREEQVVGRPAAPLLGTLARGEHSYDVRETALLGPRGEVTGRLLVLRDVTERTRMEAELRRNAFYDSLTQLPNRALFLDRLEQAIARSSRGRHPFAILFLDLDRFKVVNDSLGHHAGDELLVAVSRRLEACLRPSDTVARLGGDEFAVLLEEIQGPEHATQVAERIQAAVVEPVRVGEHEVATSVSIGVVLGPVPQGSAELLLRHADLAMYRAKKSRVVRYQVFDQAMHEQALDRLRLETELRRAVAGGELRLFYQPIVATGSERVAGFEALLRWAHPERGLLEAGEFMRVAQETGSIIAIGEQVLAEACRQLREWQEALPSDPPLRLSVNLSTRELLHPEAIPLLERSLRAAPPLPGTLQVEVADGALADSPEVVRVLAHLGSLGVRLSVENFGTGSFSLVYLHRVPVGAVKVDPSLVERVETDMEAAEVVRTLVSLARTLGVSVIAPGVETPAQRDRLAALGCEYMQGYLFWGPLAAEEATALLRARRGAGTLPAPAA